MLAVVLWLSLWLACGSLLLAVVDGLGAHPVRRALIGLALVAIAAWAVWRREAVTAWLRTRPWLAVPLASAQITAAAVDGLPYGPYLAFSMTSIAVAVIVARPRTVWLCVALLDAGYASGVAVALTPAGVVRGGHLGGVLGGLLGFPCAALIGLVLVRSFTGLLRGAEPTLDAIRDGGPTLTPALRRAIERGARAPLEAPPAPPAPPPAPQAGLTPAERRVVEGLATGRAPKELAHESGVALATVRTHIKHAKRKTGARTLAELAALTARADWPTGSHRGR